MKWEIITRLDEWDRLFAALASLNRDQAILVTTNGSKRVRRIQQTALLEAKRRRLKISTHTVSKDSIEIVPQGTE